MTTEQRLERLERKVRWMRRIGVVAVAVAVAVFLIGQGKEKVPPDLVVRSLTMKDRDGKVRAALHVKDNRFPTLVFFDSHGGRCAGLGFGAGGPALQLFDPHGIERTGLFMGPDGPGLSLSDKDGNARAVLITRPDETSLLRLLDKNRIPHAELDVRSDGSPRLRLSNANGNIIWQAPKD